MFAAGPARSTRVLVGDGTGVLFQGAIVSIMILIPANALSISPCTRSTSDLRNFCNVCNSDDRPSSPSIEFEVNRATEDLIRSGSSLGNFFSANLLTSASCSEFRGAELSTAGEGVEASIGFSVPELDTGRITDVNNITRRVNNCLGVIDSRQIAEPDTPLVLTLALLAYPK